MNLLKETIQEIKDAGLRIKDIIFIGCSASGHSCSWEEFEKLADFEYDNGYGGAEVAMNLEIAFSCGARMTRGEYDGSEWWEFTFPFKMPIVKKPIESLFNGHEFKHDT